MEETPVVEAPKAAETPAAEATPTQVGAEAPKAEAKPSPAQDLRNVQMLLVSGIYPGNIAPQVVAAYQLLEKMAQKVEADAKADGPK